jgi:hypothetical protein
VVRAPVGGTRIASGFRGPLGPGVGRAAGGRNEADTAVTKVGGPARPTRAGVGTPVTRITPVTRVRITAGPGERAGVVGAGGEH